MYSEDAYHRSLPVSRNRIGFHSFFVFFFFFSFIFFLEITSYHEKFVSRFVTLKEENSPGLVVALRSFANASLASDRAARRKFSTIVSKNFVLECSSTLHTPRKSIREVSFRTVVDTFLRQQRKTPPERGEKRKSFEHVTTCQT